MTEIIDPTQAKARVPDHVVYRDFPLETIVLNVSTGQYHGLNPVAGAMLTQLNLSPSIAAAIDALGDDFDAPRDQIDADVLKLCHDLLDRGLITIDELDQ